MTQYPSSPCLLSSNSRGSMKGKNNSSDLGVNEHDLSGSSALSYSMFGVTKHREFEDIAPAELDTSNLLSRAPRLFNVVRRIFYLVFTIANNFFGHGKAFIAGFPQRARPVLERLFPLFFFRNIRWSLFRRFEVFDSAGPKSDFSTFRHSEHVHTAYLHTAPIRLYSIRAHAPLLRSVRERRRAPLALDKF